KQDIQLALLGRDRLIEPVKVTWVRNVPLHGGDVGTDFSRGFVQFGLPAAGNKDIRALLYEAFGGGEANSAASSRDDGDLSFKSRHCYAALHLVALRSTISVPIGSLSFKITGHDARHHVTHPARQVAFTLGSQDCLSTSSAN